MFKVSISPRGVLFRGDEMSKPLFRAPHGMVWSYGGGEAHLLPDMHNPGEALCGSDDVGRILSFQVGGYYAQPCMECIAIQWESSLT